MRNRKKLRTHSKNPPNILEEKTVDSQTGMLPGIPESAMCVQRFDDSRNSAIHTTYRNSLRSSSLREPRDPLSKVVFCFLIKKIKGIKKSMFVDMIIGALPENSPL